MAKILVLAENPSSLKSAGSADRKIVFLDKGLGKNSVLANLSAEELDAEEQNAFWWTKHLAFTPMLEGKSLTELLAAGDSSLWWTQDHWFYDGTIMGYTIADLFKYAKAIIKCIEQEEPEEIYFVSPRREIFFLTAQIAKQRGITFNSQGTGVRGIIRQTRPFVLEYGKQAKQALRYFITRIHPAFKKEYGRKTTKILGVAFDADFGPVTDSLGNQGWGNRQVGELINKLDEAGFTNVWLEREASSKINLKLMQRKLPKFLPYEGFWQLRMRKQAARKNRELREAWRKLAVLDISPAGFFVAGVDFWPALKDRIRLLLTVRAPESYRNILALTRALETLSPEAVVLTDEGDSYGRAMLIAAKQLRIPTVAIQHGFFHPFHFAYRSDNRMESGFNLKSEVCPIATVTCVYGEYAREVLTKHGSYPLNSVAITGAPKFDYLQNAPDLFNRQRTLQDLGLSTELQTVTLITQPLPDFGQREQILRTVCSAVQEIPGVQLIVKMHPAEFDTELFRKIFTEYGIRGLVIREFNTHAILAASDIMVCKNSTTVLEAALLGCKVMTVNLSNEKEYVPIAGIGGIIESHSKEEVIATIRHGLQERGFASRLQLLNYHLRNEDGKATSRVMETINSLLKS